MILLSSVMISFQKKHEVLVDSLPYIDKEFDDDSMKDVIERQAPDIYVR